MLSWDQLQVSYLQDKLVYKHRRKYTSVHWYWGFQVALVVKNPSIIVGDIRDAGSIPGLKRSPGGGNGNPLQSSCLENPMDRGDWWATVHRVAKSWTRLKWVHMHAHTGTEQREIFMNAFHALCICAQLCLPLCNHRGYSPPDSSVHGIFQARVLEWLAISCSMGSSRPRDWTHVSCVSCTGGWILYHWAAWEAHLWMQWHAVKAWLRFF